MRWRWVIGLWAIGLAGAAAAETLPVEGVYAAGTDAPSRARSIAIAEFSGRGGERLAFAIDSALRNATIEGQPWFDLSFTAPAFGDAYTYDGGAGQPVQRGGPDAVLRGIGDVEVRDTDSGSKEVEECVTRDETDRCSERRKVAYPCRERNVTLRPEVRLVSREGELLYAKGDTLIVSRRFCEDEETTPPVSGMIEELASRFAAEVRGDLAPTERYENIRVLESRDGIAKADHAAFRAALRLTKNDIAGACRGFAALEAGNPADITILFNIGLCQESAGDLEAAAQVYQRVLAIKPGKAEAEEGLARIASRLRAERQLALHYGEEAG